MLTLLLLTCTTAFADPPRVYAAGPLFNAPERHEMAEIARALEADGFDVFLPHRDGFEFAAIFPYMTNVLGMPKNATQRVLGRAIDALDVYEVARADALVMNINGRAPDEGAVVELTIAWLMGKATVIYRNDIRSLTDGINNPLVTGRAGFTEVSTYADIGPELRRRLPARPRSSARLRRALPPEVRRKFEQGAVLSRLLDRSRNSKQALPELIDTLVRMFAAECEIRLGNVVD